MTSKITLYSDKALIEEMKKYAKEQNTSVSKIVNTFFQNLLHTKSTSTQKENITNSLIGSLKEETSSKEYKDYLADKYAEINMIITRDKRG